MYWRSASQSSLALINCGCEHTRIVEEGKQRNYVWLIPILRVPIHDNNYDIPLCRSKKILVTFPNVSDDFSMPHGAFVRSCYRCGAQGQKTVIEYEK